MLFYESVQLSIQYVVPIENQHFACVTGFKKRNTHINYKKLHKIYVKKLSNLKQLMFDSQS